MTEHWTKKNWCLQSIIFAFKQFFTPHTLLFDVLCEWVIESNIFAITTDDGSKVIAGVYIMNEKLRKESYFRV